MFDKVKSWFQPKPRTVTIKVPVKSDPKKYFEYFVNKTVDGEYAWLMRAYIPDPTEVNGVSPTAAKARSDAQAAGKKVIK